MNKIQRFERNTAGRDFAVGDIHGYFTRLQAALDAAGFDPKCDRLFSVGDLVDRGPESEQAVEWLAMPWFHAVHGNHEQMTIDSHCEADTDLHFINGGAWFYGLPSDERASIAGELASLPLVIEVETEAGLVGLVHADCPRRDWADLTRALAGNDSEAEHVEAMCLWSRRRIDEEDVSGVTGIRAVVVGHTWLPRPAMFGNVYHIDTGGWLPEEHGYFTLIDLATLQTIPPMPDRLHWEAA